MYKEMGVVELQERDFLGIREEMNPSMISERMGPILQELFSFIGSRRIAVKGPPFTYYHSFSPDSVDMECGVPVSGPLEGGGRIKPGRLPGGRAVRALHFGPYELLEETYTAMMAFTKERDLEVKGPIWEYYHTDPSCQPDPSKWKTEIFLQLK